MPKPIGFKPDGTHIHKGALALIICFVIGLYCMASDAPFGMPKTVEKPIEKKVETK